MWHIMCGFSGCGNVGVYSLAVMFVGNDMDLKDTTNHFKMC